MVLLKLWKCERCGYVHQGADPPETCPICGAEQTLFSSFTPPSTEGPSTPATAWRCPICGYEHSGGVPPGQCPVCGAEGNLFEPLAGRKADFRIVEGPSNILILGAGVAGLTAAEQVRLLSPEATITLVSEERAPSYFRLNLTRFLAGEVGAEELVMKDLPWLEEHRIQWIEGKAEVIDRAARSVRLAGGKSLTYDRLILAIGAHPFVPPLPGTDLQGVSCLRTRENALALLARAEPGRHVICVGGGLLGLETAGALRTRGLQVTVLEGGPHLLPRQLAAPAAQRLQAFLDGLGIRVKLNARVKALLGKGVVREVALEGGDRLPADLVVLATGVRPNTAIARKAGLEVGTGLKVDDRMFTSDPSILACGDVIEHMGVTYGIWPAAHAQGLTAGTNAAGGTARFEGIPPSNRIKVLGVDLFSIGRFEPRDGADRVFEQEQEGRYIRIVVRDGRTHRINSNAADILELLDYFAAQHRDADLPFPLPAGGVGYLGYECAAGFDRIRLTRKPDPLAVPEAGPCRGGPSCRP